MDFARLFRRGFGQGARIWRSFAYNGTLNYGIDGCRRIYKVHVCDMGVVAEHEEIFSPSALVS